MTMSVTTLGTPAHSRREPIFSKRLFTEQATFALMAWAVGTLCVLALTFIVSFYRPIESSGWHIASQAVRWFAFAIGCYLGWTIFQLHVTHGGTRRGYLVKMITFTAAYAPLLAVLYTLSFWIEGLVYGLMGWVHGLDRQTLYQSASDLPMIFLESVLIFGLWLIGGLFIALMFYRNSILGSLSIAIGLILVTLSGYSMGNYQTPFDLEWIEWLRPLPASWDRAVLFHVVMMAVTLGLAWLAVRQVPIRSKSAEKG
jgi:hypothetical protein